MPYVVPVKFAFAARDLWFDPGDLDIMESDYAVCSTERGTEIGLVTADPFEVGEDELKAPLKPVLRIADDGDLDRAEELADRGEAAMTDFRAFVKKNDLDMKPVGVEFLFGGERTVFYFAAEDRVDFRQLVKDLSAHFHTRVDMRQIGVRDETRLVGGYAQCGQELCCARFGGQFEPVSIRMAKEQDLPLNSSKISGVCGRLMCCLRYEFEAYKDFKSRAPKKKAIIDTPLGKAKIQECDTPREQLVLRLESGKTFRVNLSDMTCSDACKKKAAEQGCACRPDCVTRDVLEKIDSPDIALALLELDRENGLDVGDGLDQADRIVTSGPTSRRRRSAGNGQQSQKGQKPSSGRGRPAGDGKQGDGSRGQASSSRRRRKHTGSSPEAGRGGFMDGAAKASAASEGTSRRRRHHHAQATTASPSSEGAQRGSEGEEKASRRTRRRRHTTEQRKPEVPSVADQLAEGGPVKVTRRRPGDGGGQARRENAAAEGAGESSSHRRRRRRGPRKHRPSGEGGADGAASPQGE